MNSDIGHNAENEALERGKRILESRRGRYTAAKQSILENSGRINSAIGPSATWDMRNAYTPEGKLDIKGITGGYEKYEKELNSVIKRVGESGDPSKVGFMGEINNLRRRSLAREFAERDEGLVRNYMRRNLGIGKGAAEVTKATAPRYGGGADNMFMLGWDVNNNIGSAQHINRAARFAAGAGLGTDLLNSAGIMTRHQKNILKASSTGVMQKAGTLLAPAFGIAAIVDTTSQYVSGERETTITDNAITGAASSVAELAALTYGYRVTKEATHAITSAIPFIGNTARGGKLGVAAKLFKAGSGFLAGAAGAIGLQTATSAVLETSRSIASQDNSLNRAKRQLTMGDTSSDASVQTQQLLTARQRALEKLSASSMNDRAMVFGNEAKILKGII